MRIRYYDRHGNLLWEQQVEFAEEVVIGTATEENAALTKRVERLEGLLRQAIAATEAANAAVILQSVRTGLPYEGPVFNVTEAKQALEDK